MGDPNAKVRLLEIASLSCPHCQKFEEEGAPSLVDKYVKTGKVSWEFRPYLIHGPVDMAANLVVRCNGARRFFPLVASIYKDQSALLDRIQAAPQEKVEQLQTLPKEQMFIEMAGILGLQDWAALRGVQHAESKRCLSDPAMIDQEVQISSDVTAQYPEFTGTPAFVINGTMLPKGVTTWDKLEPALIEALR
jgi:protein-disulfide isomerase